MSREAMQQALEALERGETKLRWAAITALRAALAEPEHQAKPITGAEMSAWVKDTWEKCQADAWQEQEPFMVVASECAERGCMAHDDRVDGPGVVLQSREKQEPVAWIDDSGHPRHLSYVQGVREKQLYGPLRPLYTAPTPRNEPVIDKTMAVRIATQLGWEPAKKPLSVEDLAKVIDANWGVVGVWALCRAIERAHGIGEQHE